MKTFLRWFTSTLLALRQDTKHRIIFKSQKAELQNAAAGPKLGAFHGTYAK